MFRELPLTPNSYEPESDSVGKIMKLSFQPYKFLLKRTPYVAVASFLVLFLESEKETKSKL